jgi:drug/metabolite transporter (DMT)-like permease
MRLEPGRPRRAFGAGIRGADRVALPSSALRDRLLLVAAAVLFSTGGVAVKAASLNGWQMASCRSGVAAVVLLALLPETRRGWNWRIVPVAAAYAATLVSFVVANRLTTAADAIFLQSTAPFYLLLLGPILLREPIHRSDLLFMAPIAVGLALFFVGAEPAVRTAPDPARGNLFALASGLAYALALAGLRWVARRDRDSGMAAVALGNVLACLAALPLALPIRHISAADAGVVLYLGVAQIGVAYWCVTRAMRHVTALEANTVLLLEPALNPIWVWLVHGERPGPWALSGGAIILLTTLANTWRTKRN